MQQRTLRLLGDLRIWSPPPIIFQGSFKLVVHFLGVQICSLFSPGCAPWMKLDISDQFFSCKTWYWTNARTCKDVVVIFRDSSVLYRLGGSNSSSLRNGNWRSRRPTIAQPGSVLTVWGVHWAIEDLWKLARHLHLLHDRYHCLHHVVAVVFWSVQTEREIVRRIVDTTVAR